MSRPLDYLDSLVDRRQRFIDDIIAVGGIDFDEILDRSPDASGNNTSFKSLGGIAVQGIYLGFKQFRRTSHWELDGFAQEVATLRHIGRQAQKYQAMLPRIHYEVRNQSKPLGILTEDFTQGGRMHKVAETPIDGLADMFTHPDIIEEDNTQGVLGVFQSIAATGQAGRTPRIIDVMPLYSNYRFHIRPGERLPDWLAEEIGLAEVMAKLDALRISIGELAAE